MAKLTIKQEKFCLEYVIDGNASRAYREAYDAANMKEATISNSAYKLLQNDEIKAKIEQLRTETTKSSILSIEQRKELLTKIAMSEAYDKFGNPSFTDVRGAIDLLNKMDGVYVVKNQTELSGEIAIAKIVELPKRG
jgi:hypothetical protein